jgi:hypothetical protein
MTAMIRRLLTPPLLVSMLALVISLGGTSYTLIQMRGSAPVDPPVAGARLASNIVPGQLDVAELSHVSTTTVSGGVLTAVDGKVAYGKSLTLLDDFGGLSMYLQCSFGHGSNSSEINVTSTPVVADLVVTTIVPGNVTSQTPFLQGLIGGGVSVNGATEVVFTYERSADPSAKLSADTVSGNFEVWPDGGCQAMGTAESAPA